MPDSVDAIAWKTATRGAARRLPLTVDTELPRLLTEETNMTRISSIVLGLTIVGLSLTIDLEAQSRPAANADGQHDSAQMMAQQQKMTMEMQASQKKLDELVAQMNSATGSAKVDRIAALLTELVAQHRRMSTMMEGGTMPMMRGNAPAATPAPATGAKPEDHADHHK